MNDTALAVEVSQPLADARAIQIKTQEHYASAGEMLKGIMALKKRVNDTFDPIIKKSHEAHREALSQKKAHETPLVDAERILKTRMLEYQDAQEQIRLREQARLEEAARKEKEKLEAQAAKAEAKGKTEKADELKTRAEMVAAPVVSIETPKVAGISTRESYKAVVFNKDALVEASVGGRRVSCAKYQGPERRRQPVVPSTVILYDQAAINQILRRTQSKWPGTRLDLVKTMASGT